MTTISKQVPQPAVSYVEDVLVQQHQRYHEKSATQAAKMRTLEEYLQEIEVTHWHPEYCCHPESLVIRCVWKQTNFIIGRTSLSRDVLGLNKCSDIGKAERETSRLPFDCGGSNLQAMVISF